MVHKEMKPILLLSILCLLTGCATVTQADTPPFTWPKATKTVTLKAPIVVKAGTTFDAKLTKYVAAPVLGDGSQREGQRALFILEPGATLKNAILGFPAADGVHCKTAPLKTTKVINCHWLDVGEDALTITGNGKFLASACQFQHATDKSVQINSAAEVTLSNCRFRKFARAIRGCGTCGNIAYDITAEDCTAYDGDTFLKLSNSKGRGVIRGLKAKNLSTIADASGGAKISIK